MGGILFGDFDRAKDEALSLSKRGNTYSVYRDVWGFRLIRGVEQPRLFAAPVFQCGNGVTL